jgi:NAD(P)-dependent dehydrogenase (short-subunit alcohol dehydrogenase family)
MPSPRFVTDDRRSQKHILEIRAQPHKTPSPSSFAGLAQVRDGFPGALPAARRHALDTFACPLELFWKLSSFWILTVKAESQVAENQENPEGERRKCRPASAQSSRVEPTGLGRLSAKDWPPKAPKWWSRTSPTARKPSAPSKRAGGSAVAVRCDQTSEADVNKLRDTVERELGGCDILVHCAGIYPTAAIDEITFDQWRKVLSVNLDSVFLLVKAFLPGMKERGWGRIISVSSTTFHSGIGFNTHYTASKGGLIGFARSLASEVGDFGITVNTIAPGLTRTDTTINGKPGEFGWFEMIRGQQAIKRTETPEDLTGTLAFLTSDDAAFITGQTIVVDGGWRFS